MPHPPQPLASLQQVLVTPSRQDGVPEDLEDDLRVVGCVLIQELGILLELQVFRSQSLSHVSASDEPSSGDSPQSTLATAQVLLQRFFYVSSLSSYTVNEVAIGSLYLSSKLTESQVRLRDLLNVYLLYTARNEHLQNLSTDQLAQPDPLVGFAYNPPSFHSGIYYELKDVVVVAEMQILKRLGFHVQASSDVTLASLTRSLTVCFGNQVDLPYSHMINYCKILDLVNKPGAVQLCWSILNDALQTPVYAHYPPTTIACFSILLATRLLIIPLPDSWWLLFDADYDDMWTACGHVTRLWRDWSRGDDGRSAVDTIREARWRRGWKLSVSRKYVRRYVEQVKAEDDKRRA